MKGLIVNRFVWILVLAMVMCLLACKSVIPPPTTVPAMADTEPTAADTPTQTTEQAANTILWERENADFLYTYEDYFAYERVFQGVHEELSEYIRAEGYVFTPYEKGGKLYLEDKQKQCTVRVGSKEYTQLQIFGTDGIRWIYCAEAGKELFRIDPLGSKEILFTDEHGRIGSGELDSGHFRLEDRLNLAYFTAGSETGYGIYRLHIPSMRVDLVAEAEEPISLWRTKSNYQISYFVGSYLGGGEIILTTPAKEWDFSDPNIQLFQTLLSPNQDGLFHGRSNWYNAATFLLFECPEAVPLRGLMRNGFDDISPELTDRERTALDIEAGNYSKLPCCRINQILDALFGLQLADMENNTLAQSADVHYLAESDTYYLKCSMVDDGDGKHIYIWKQEITIHKVEECADNFFRVYYLPHTPAPFGSAEDWQEHVMVLKKVEGSYHIISNQFAVLPMSNCCSNS